MDEKLKKLLKPIVDKIDKMLVEGNLGEGAPIFEVEDGKIIADPIVKEYLKEWEKKE